MSEYRRLTDGSAYLPWVRALDGSGVYLIRSRSTGRLLYIGESHTGNLRKTLLRHFQNWSRSWTSARWWTGRETGWTGDRHAVEVRIVRAPAGKVADLQYKLIARLRPEHNKVGEAPF